MAINRVTELDFDQIKTNLKSFLSSQDEFTDFDFDGAGISVLLDLLAYNTQYNAVLSHIAMNEAFLDSASVRSNVVSHSKLVGYVPRSAVSSKMYVDLLVTGDGSSPTQIEMPRGTIFTTTISGQSYNFVNLDSIVAGKNSSNQYAFSNVELYQGKIKTFNYRVDGTIAYQKFIIQDTKVDTDTLRVRVYSSEQSVSYDDYVYYNDITQINSESKVFFFQENANGFYEVYFGDGVLGKALANNNIVEIQYLSTDGSAGNGANAFTAADTIGGLSNIVVSSSTGFTQSFNGADKETIEAIRQNAPLYYASQNRAVTGTDYRSIILNEYPDIEDVAVWGGETAQPPVYGKVFISIKAQNQDYVSQERKEIISSFVERKNVGSITTEVLDPDYTKLIITSLFKYNTELTNRSKNDLETLVRNQIISYNTNTLNKFDGVFRSSNLIGEIDDLDPGILNNVMRIKMYKEIVPNTLFGATYTLTFSSPIYITSSTENILTSTAFTLNNISCRFEDVAVSGSTNRTIKVVNNTTRATIPGYENVGTIVPSTGVVEITGVQFESTDNIQIICSPESNDIAPKFNQLVQIDASEITITSELDTISAYGTTGSSEYTTFARHD